jgi:hypothetical protein
MDNKNETKAYKICIILLLIAMTIITWLNYATSIKSKKIINELKNQVKILQEKDTSN